MLDILKIAARNLLRYKRRTALSALLISIGLVAVLEEIEQRAQIKHQADYTLDDIDQLDGE